MSAMKKMNQSYLSSACTQPIVVKFADTPREKEKRKLERQVNISFIQQACLFLSGKSENLNPGNKKIPGLFEKFGILESGSGKNSGNSGISGIKG